MLGGMLSGHDESSGDIITIENKKYKLFYGMSSGVAMQKYMGGVADYRASEGKVVVVPYRGSIDETIKQILGSRHFYRRGSFDLHLCWSIES